MVIQNFLIGNNRGILYCTHFTIHLRMFFELKELFFMHHSVCFAIFSDLCHFLPYSLFESFSSLVDEAYSKYSY